MKKIPTTYILAETLKEMLNVKSFEKITVTDILRESHVSRATFYKYFCDKEQLLEYILRQDIINPIFMNRELAVSDHKLVIFDTISSKRRFFLNAFEVPTFVSCWRKESAKSLYALYRPRCDLPEQQLWFICRTLGSTLPYINQQFLMNGVECENREKTADLWQNMCDRAILSTDISSGHIYR